MQGEFAYNGSSPRTWGTLRHREHRGRVRRFIPTHVGNALTSTALVAAVTVHPHARGERAPRPRAVQRSARFIPTHVGNADLDRQRGGCKTVHPHARGERELVDDGPVMRGGSSPRTWGTLAVYRLNVFNVRFIPTHVGNASIRSSAILRSTVHPHARGERSFKSTGCGRATGSSPRTWGTPGNKPTPAWHARFIPTHVGNANSAPAGPQ